MGHARKPSVNFIHILILKYDNKMSQEECNFLQNDFSLLMSIGIMSKLDPKKEISEFILFYPY